MKLFFSALLASLIFSSPVLAAGVTKQEGAEADVLVELIRAQGITVYLDSDVCETAPLDGFYSGVRKVLVLCNKGSREVTQANLNTLRHETMHIMQDCKDGKLDNKLNTILKQGEAEKILKENGISPERIKSVYNSFGKGDHVPFELEAFAGGTMPTRVIIKAFNTYCPLK